MKVLDQVAVQENYGCNMTHAQVRAWICTVEDDMAEIVKLLMSCLDLSADSMH